MDDHEELHRSIRSGRSCSRFDQPRIQHRLRIRQSSTPVCRQTEAPATAQNSIGARRTAEPTHLLAKNEINAGTAVPGVLNAVLESGTIGGPSVYFVQVALPTRSARPGHPKPWFSRPWLNRFPCRGLIAGGLTGNMSFSVNPGDLETQYQRNGCRKRSRSSRYRTGASIRQACWKDNFTVVYTGQVCTDSGKFLSAASMMTELKSPSMVTL